MKKIKIITSILVFFTIGVMACDNLVESPSHIMTGDNLFQDSSGFELAVNGLYAETRWDYNKGIMVPNRVTTDALVCNSCFWGYNLMLKEMGDRVDASEPNILNIWVKYYEIINTANNIIFHAKAEGVNLSTSEKEIILADAKAVRGWAYRHLTYFWGDVPMPLEPSSGQTIKTDWERIPINEVRGQIIDDLLYAQEQIPDEGTIPGRMTKGAVQHWLSEMYLAIGEDEEALFWADEVINNPVYELITNRYGDDLDQPGVPFMDMFKPGNTDRHNGNTEALWVFQFAQGVTGGGEDVSPRPRYTASNVYEQISIDGVQPLHITPERGGRGTARQNMTKWMLELYEPDDHRGSENAIRYYFVLNDADSNAPHPADNLPTGWAYGDTLWLNFDQPITPQNEDRFDWPFTKKFDWAIDDNPAIRENFHSLIYLRLAETYMLKAEAHYNLGDLSAAAETVNIIRRRSNASEITAGDIDIDFILDERARELIHEEHRRHQLVRTGKWYERTTQYNLSAAARVYERNELFPIPQSVIDANETEFPQNPGY